MPAQKAATPNRTSSVIPPLVCEHGDDVAEVRAEEDYRLFVRFFDGTSGCVDLSRLVQSPEAGVFAELADTNRFRAVTIELGAVTWPGGLDLAPDAMYQALRTSGEWILS